MLVGAFSESLRRFGWSSIEQYRIRRHHRWPGPPYRRVTATCSGMSPRRTLTPPSWPPAQNTEHSDAKMREIRENSNGHTVVPPLKLVGRGHGMWWRGGGGTQSSSVCVVTTRSVRSSLISCLCAHCALLHGKLRYCDAAEKVLSGAKMSTLSC